MRSVFFSFLAVISPWFSAAQMATPAVTNLAGWNIMEGTSAISVSIGEPSITTLSAGNVMITQGYLQPEILPCVDMEFSYYPNPATTEITIEAYGCEVQIKSMELLNLWGQIITTIEPRKDNKVIIEGLSQGVYLVKVYLSSGISKTIKIVKIAP